MRKNSFKLLTLFVLTILIKSNSYAQTGTWTAVTRTAPNNCMGVMLLLTDGTVICKDDAGSGEGTGWNRLTPDTAGNYANGTWTSIGSMINDRLFFPSQVLPNGKVFVAGGEYSNANGSTSGEVYDPVADTWSATNAVTGGQNIYDGNSEILATGTVLVGLQAGNVYGYTDLFYTNSTNNWTNAPQAPLDHDEAAWLKLPDYSILFVGISTQKSCRYIPASNTWVNDANLPVALYDNYGSEAGGAYMLPNGKAVFFGATGQNAIYTPSGTASPGTWAAAANFPSISGTQTGQIDAAGAMMVNGHILLAVSPVNTSNSDQFRAPFWFVEYDYTTNTFSQVTSILSVIGADSVPGVPCNFSNLLDLPNGQVLFGVSEENNNQYWVYTPGSAAIPQGKPTINSVYETTCGTYFARGKLFNGISEGAGFGDDWQMETNYPIIRLTNTAGHVYYCKTTNWNRIGAVQTDSLEDTVQFSIPASLPAGTYSLVVTANGFASNPTLFTPFAATASANGHIACHGDSSASATITVGGGKTPYTYRWSDGATTSSINNLTAGTYTVTVTDNKGCTSTSTITITQPNALTVTAHASTEVLCNGGSTGVGTCTASGGTSPYTYRWSSGATTAVQNGLSAGTYTITVTDKNGCTATATATVTQPALLKDTATVTEDVACHGGNTGSASSSASGGISPYTYAWSGGGTNSTKTGLTAGTYTITIKDKNGCSATAKVTITQPPTALSITQGSHSTVYPVKCSGTAWVTAAGGTAPYTYSWSPGGGTTDTIKNQCAGSYCCTVKDNHGCVDSVCVNVVTAIQTIEDGSSINIYPDPSNGRFFIEISIPYNKSIVEITNVLGQQVLTQEITGTKNQLNLEAQPSGVYFYRVLNEDGSLQGMGKLLIQK